MGSESYKAPAQDLLLPIEPVQSLPDKREHHNERKEKYDIWVNLKWQEHCQKDKDYDYTHGKGKTACASSDRLF